jgi:uncharacterized membrane protein YkvA (DUF1232 family)
MPFKLTIELSERDLRHFRRELRRAHEAVSIADDEEILAAAADLVATLRASDLPDFVSQRLEKLQSLYEMLNDADWPLGEAERSQVLAALAYVCDPEDIIPDEIPGIGLLDDAVMIELVFRELRHAIEAYEDFRAYRKSSAKRLPGSRNAPALARQLAQRRVRLMTRAKRRQAAGKR